MESLDLARIPDGALLMLDSAPLIFLLEGRAGFAERYRPLLKAQAAGQVRFAVSAITMIEVLAGPLQKRQEALAARYQRLMESWLVVPLDVEVAASAARIRATEGLKLPDAVQVASTIAAQAHALVTHDRDFSGINAIRVLTA
jgi:predicted nucleic acid-binding protein